MTNVRVCINLPKPLYERLEEKANANNVTVNEIITLAIMTAIEQL